MAFDIKGAFDNVSKNKLIKRLWDHKISLLLICWTDSFLTQRTAAMIRRQNRNPANVRDWSTTRLASIAYPVYVVYGTAVQDPKRRKQKSRTRIRGYVDDGLLTSVAASENEAAVKLQEVFAIANKWAYENGLSFDLGKFEATHFSRKRNLPNPSIRSSLTGG